MPAATKKAEKTAQSFGEKPQGIKKAEYKTLFQAEPRNFGIGGSVLPKQYLNVHRYIRWPEYVRQQRQKRVLLKRLRVPPTLNQFTKTATRELAAQTLNFLNNYKPESPEAKKERLRAAAEQKLKSGEAPATKPQKFIRAGSNEVTKAIERKKAQLVLIAHDVDPIETVVYLPALCKKMDVPYLIIKSQDRLGKLLFRKKASCIALTDVRKEDRDTFAQIAQAARGAFNERYYENTRHWGGGNLSKKSLQARAKLSA